MMLVTTLLFLTHLSVSSSPQHKEHHSAESEGPGFLGSYPVIRDASGTSWQPDSSPMEGAHFQAGGFDGMVHGFLNLGFMSESGPRGENEPFGTGMLMVGGRRNLGGGSLGLRFMGSLEPVMGPAGYALLLQTGETANGEPLLDRQHPHDAFMEVAATYSRPLGRDSSWFVYLAPVGEPAIGPPAFMHRFSAGENPLAPVTHHWFDSTHITYGVVTLGGVIANRAKIEGSIFNGREPDEHRWDIEELDLNSYSVRFTANPTPNWSFQASMASLNEPERLHPGIDYLRLTLSATFNVPREDGNWQTTVAWGRNKRERATFSVDPSTVTVPTHNHGPGLENLNPVLTQNAILVESAVRVLDTHGLFARFEWVQKDELFPVTDPFHAAVFPVTKVNVGYTNDFVRAGKMRLGVGMAASLHFLAVSLEPAYGGRPASAYVFFRAGIR